MSFLNVAKDRKESHADDKASLVVAVLISGIAN